jgi:hypothetical protein
VPKGDGRGTIEKVSLVVAILGQDYHKNKTSAFSSQFVAGYFKATIAISAFAKQEEIR